MLTGEAPCGSSLYRPASCLEPVVRTFQDGLGQSYTYSFVQLFQIFPWLSPFYHPFEKNFDAREGYRFIDSQRWLPVISIVLYAAMIALLPKYTIRSPWKVTNALAVWNLFLGGFSFIGSIRTVPHLLHWLATTSFYDTLCAKPETVFGDGATGLWCLLFTLSKVFELVDTFFVVAKGKKPIFLHWYHHVSVLLFTWTTYALRHNGLYFIAMNYTVHAVMYTYYFLMAINAKPKWLNPLWITILQISQMIVGVLITICAFYFTSTSACPGQVHRALYFQGIMYGSYLYLFLNFMCRRFILNSRTEFSVRAKVDRTA